MADTDVHMDSSLPSGLPTLMYADIRRRGLTAGDQYLTAKVAGDEFGTSRATADRAMQVLVRHGVLERRRGQGTFLTDALAPSEATMPVVIVLAPEFRGRLSSPQRTSLPGLLHGHFPGAIVQSTPVIRTTAERAGPWANRRRPPAQQRPGHPQRPREGHDTWQPGRGADLAYRQVD